MKQIASRGRLLLRKVLIGLSAGAVALMFQACYGMPPVDDPPETVEEETEEEPGTDETQG